MKTLAMIVSLVIGISMTILLYILPISTTIGYDSYYFTVLPLVIFLVLCVTPEDHAFER